MISLVNINGSLSTGALPISDEVPTQDDQLVNKLYVDTHGGGGGGSTISQINLNDFSENLNLTTGDINITLSPNTLNYVTNDLDINSYIPLGLGANYNTTSSVYAVALDSVGNVYIGGTFTGVGNISANYIAKWDGSTWSALGSGLNNNVNALAIDSNDHVYAGGVFTTAGGSSANRIAKWDGSTWTAIESGFNNNVNSVAIDSYNNVYAGGIFSATSDGTLANCIAMWNGVTWSALGSGMSTSGTPNVAALAIDSSNNVYAGGNFTSAGGTPANYIAMWNGYTWSNLQDGLYAFGATMVNALAVDLLDNVYVGGTFNMAHDTMVNNIAKWNGSTWTAMGNGLIGSCNAISINPNNNDIYVGGAFLIAGENAANRIAKWNGTTWTAMGDGLNSTCRALAMDASGNVYVGGLYVYAGGASINRIALYSPSTTSSSLYSTQLYVNNKYLTTYYKTQTVVVNVTSDGIPYANNILA